MAHLIIFAVSLSVSTTGLNSRNRGSCDLLLRRTVLMFLKFYRKKSKHVLDFPSRIEASKFTIKDQHLNTSNFLFLSAYAES